MTRRSAAWLVALFLAITPAAWGQEEAPPEEGTGSSGNPLYGYMGTAVLAAGAIFVLCKSSRR
jgi:LPXTG-motif cell wall-anchored protein